MSYTSSSFYLDDDNAAYINEQIKDKKRYNKSNWLNDLVDHLRDKAESKPQGFSPNPNLKVLKGKSLAKVVKRFVPPTFNEVDVYMISVGVNDNGEANKFCDFYESNGWKVGKNKMKSWQAAVRNWLKNNKPKQQGTKQFSDITNQNIDTIGEWLNE